MPVLNLSSLLFERLPAELLERLDRVRREAARLEVPTWLVGGVVRDALARRTISSELDLAVEGEAGQLAGALAAHLGGVVRRHPRFLTARLELGGGARIDLATCRAEVYPHAAALPTVHAAPLMLDLMRRDYSVNALAVQLHPPPFGELVDPTAGLRDLEEGRLRVLHGRSFLDDPTRAFRGVALEARLGWSLEPRTLAALSRALGEGAFDRLSGSRLNAAVHLLVASPSPALATDRAAALGLLETLDCRLIATTSPGHRLAACLDAADRLAPAAGARPVAERLSLIALASCAGADAEERIADRLGLGGPARRALSGAAVRRARTTAALSAFERRPSELHRLLSRLALEELCVLWALEPEARWAIEKELGAWRRLELGVCGGDLLARGLPAGPCIGRALDETLAARLDGRIGAVEELEYAVLCAERCCSPP